MIKLSVFLINILICLSLFLCGASRIETPYNTLINVKNATRGAQIEYKIVNKPHHLFIGRCKPEYIVIHQENIIIKNDGKSQVSANIRINVEAPIKIACVKIFDEVPNGEGGYPTFVGGGLGYNYVEFNVDTNFGKGFHFFVQVYKAPENITDNNNIH